VRQHIIDSPTIRRRTYSSREIDLLCNRLLQSLQLPHFDASPKEEYTEGIRPHSRRAIGTGIHNSEGPISMTTAIRSHPSETAADLESSAHCNSPPRRIPSSSNRRPGVPEMWSSHGPMKRFPGSSLPQPLSTTTSPQASVYDLPK
jgi:hypothetical protein